MKSKVQHNLCPFKGVNMISEIERTKGNQGPFDRLRPGDMYGNLLVLQVIEDPDDMGQIVEQNQDKGVFKLGNKVIITE